MKLIMIRHAEPDYSIDSLTEKGFREAELLGKRTADWKVTDFYCSPLGRAKKTSEPTLRHHKKEATVYDWLREFHAPVDNYEKPGETRIPWDFSPKFLDENPILFDPNHWWEAPILKSGNVKEEYDRVMRGLDGLLAKYGYHRTGHYYSTENTKSSNYFMEYNGTTIECLKNAPKEEPIIVIFCHLGVMLTMMSYLLNTTPATLLHGFFIPPSSVTVLSAEERTPGEAYFRCQVAGDTSHLKIAGEPVSYYGGFSTPFNG